MAVKIQLNFNKINKVDLFAIVVLLLFLPLYLYNLGGYSLADFDEAWFAEVARNILVNKNPLILTFNQQRFLEHPPLGFWLMTIAFSVWGVNESAARFFSAIAGFGSLFMLYLLGRQIANKIIGLGASLVLTSCVWFVFRARSANLDTIFLFFYLATFYLSLKVKQNPNWLFLVDVSLAAVFLTKTLVGITILIPIIVFFIINKIRLSAKYLLRSAIIFGLLILPWFLANYIKYGYEFIYHIFIVGLRPFGLNLPNYKDLVHSLTFQYLHYGMRKWYYPALISFFVSGLFVFKKKYLMTIQMLLLTLLFFFLTNNKTEIWHLIPLYPFLAILIVFTIYQVLLLGMGLLNKCVPDVIQEKSINAYVAILTLMFTGIASLYQIYNFRNEIKLFDKDISGLAYTAIQTKSHSEKLYLYADYFLPSAVFYSQKQVYMVNSQPYPKNTLVGMIDYGDKPFLLLGEKWKFELDKINPTDYELLGAYKEYILVKVE